MSLFSELEIRQSKDKSEKIESIVKVFENNCDDRGIPKFTNQKFIELSETYDKQDIKESLALYITKNKIPFPLKIIFEDRLKQLFFKFCNKSFLDTYIEIKNVDEKFDYKNKYTDKPLGIIGTSHYYNDISDYFQQMNRMKCGSVLCDSPFEIWNNQQLLSKMNWHFWRKSIMGDNGLDEKAFRTAFRLGTYTASQFKPTVAKALYEKHKAINILDTSCGWGDRLAGFYGTNSSKLYVGCDPNPDVFEMYKKQCVFYEKILGNSFTVIEEDDNYFKCVGSKVVEIWNLPAEDVNWNLYKNTFDFYFTSPPYYETERYASDTDKVLEQSWYRYDSFKKWRDEFFYYVTKQVWNTLKTDAFMMINIIEPQSKDGRNYLCDNMVEEFQKLNNSYYIGKLGMRMNPRPNTKSHKLVRINNKNEKSDYVHVEPIWVFRKGNSNYLQNEKSITLENFFK